MRKVGVISDTHVPDRRPEIPREALRAFDGVDLILHAGDLTSLEVLEALKAIAPVVAVSGNMDRPEVRSALKKEETLVIEGKTVVLVHGFGSPQETEEMVKSSYPYADCVVFGHTHRSMNEVIGQTLYFNPGPACGTAFGPGSYGVLFFEEGPQPVRGIVVELRSD